MRYILLLLILSMNTATFAVKIMCVGNSITQGFSDDAQNGHKQGEYCYRYWLWKRITQWKTGNSYPHDILYCGMQHDYCGKPTPQPTLHPGEWDQRHEGFGGCPIQWITDSLSKYLPVLQSKDSLPDIVLLHVGTNNMGCSPNPCTETDMRTSKGAITYLETLIDKIRAYAPNVTIFLAQIIPFNKTSNDPPSWNATIVNYNNAMPGVVARKSTTNSPIYLVDQWTGYDSNNWYLVGDDRHPNEAGARAMADKWYLKLVKYLDPKKPMVPMISGSALLY
jgi:acyl-CoA thioesterase I